MKLEIIPFSPSLMDSLIRCYQKVFADPPPGTNG